MLNKRSRQLPRVVPWMHRAEWNHVSQLILSSSSPSTSSNSTTSSTSLDKEAWMEAIKRIKVWSERGKVPLAVESTASFMELSLALHSFKETNTQSEMQMRMTMAMAVVRFVNGIVDPAQQGVFAHSISDIASNIQLPQLLVDIRHDATHNHLPSFNMLVMAVQLSLDWLRNNYWKIQKDRVDDIGDQVRDMLKTYKAINFGESTQNPFFILDDICFYVSPKILRGSLISCLLSLDFLVPSSKNERATLPNFTIPESQINCWRHPLERFHYQWKTFSFLMLQSIIETLQIDEESGVDQDRLGSDANEKAKSGSLSIQVTLVAWAKQLIEIASEEPGYIDASFVNHFSNLCLRKPTKFKILILEEISKKWEGQKGSSDLNEAIKVAKKLINGSKPVKTKGEVKKVESSTDIENFIKSMEQKIINIKHEKGYGDEDIQKSNENIGTEHKHDIFIWTPMSVGEWKPCAIGSLPYSEYPSLELPVLKDDEKPIDIQTFKRAKVSKTEESISNEPKTNPKGGNYNNNTFSQVNKHHSLASSIQLF